MLIDYKDTGLPSYDIDLEEAPEDRWRTTPSRLVFSLRSELYARTVGERDVA